MIISKYINIFHILRVLGGAIVRYTDLAIIQKTWEA